MVAAQATSYGVIYDFNASPDGDRPKAGVAIGENGALYGTTSRDGQYACDRYLNSRPPRRTHGPKPCFTVFVPRPATAHAPGRICISVPRVRFTAPPRMVGLAARAPFPTDAASRVWRSLELLGDLQFGPSGSPNAQPLGAVLIAAGGGLFATAREGAAVAMAPPAQPGGAWSGNVIYSPVGSQIAAGLVSAAGGSSGRLWRVAIRIALLLVGRGTVV